MAHVVALHTYPIKGCAPTSSSRLTFTPAGPVHDRSFMVTDPDGTFRTQRTDPRLAVVTPTVHGDRLTLAAPGADPLTVEVTADGARRNVLLFATPLRGIDQGDAAAAWLTAVLGAPSRLVRVPPDHDRVTAGLTPGTSGFADSSAVLLTSHASLDLLNERLAGDVLGMDRFRANIVVDGWAEPHVEVRVRRAVVGGVELGYAKLAIRCVVTTVDQATGRGAGPEPLRTLAGYRRAAEGGVAFGAKFSVVTPGTIGMGDELIVEEWGDTEL